MKALRNYEICDCSLMYKKLKFYLNQATCVSPVPCQQTAILPLCFVIVVHHVYTWG